MSQRAGLVIGVRPCGLALGFDIQNVTLRASNYHGDQCCRFYFVMVIKCTELVGGLCETGCMRDIVTSYVILIRHYAGRLIRCMQILLSRGLFLVTGVRAVVIKPVIFP